MKNLFKKTVSILLCVAMLFGLFAVVGSGASVTPVIYIADIEDSTLYDKPNTAAAEAVFLPEQDALEQHFMYIVAGLLYATVAGEATEGNKLLLRGLNGLLRDAVCTEFGETEDGIGVNTYKYPMSYYKDDPAVMNEMLLALDEANGSVGLEHTYLFTYDWRLDPIDNAAKLKDFIAHVKSREGAKEVALLCAGNGGVVANAYLYTYADTAASDVASCVFLNSPLLGNSLVGDVMSGNLTQKLVDAENILHMYEIITATERSNALVRYVNDDPQGFLLSLFETVFGEGEYTSQFSSALVWLINSFLGGQDIWAELAKEYSKYIGDNEDVLFSGYLTDFLRYAPGLWALVPEENFEDAWYYMFPEDDASEKLEKKINDFRVVLAATQDTLKTAKENGINVCIVAGYNLQIIPISGTIDQHSDSMLLTKYASAGATTAVHGSDEVLRQAVKDGHEHLSPDSQIDASTGALPEHTWYIRNLPNMQYESESAADFVTWLLMSDHQRTIWEELRYPQYMAYSRSKDHIYALDNGTTVYYYGDANVDGFVNAGDARLALRVAVGLETISTEIGFILADVDCNGEITAGDARQILRYSVGLDLGEE